MSFVASAKPKDGWHLVEKLSCRLHLSDRYESKNQLPDSENQTVVRREKNEDSITATVQIKNISCIASAKYNPKSRQLENEKITISSFGSDWTSRAPENEIEQSGDMFVSTDNTYAYCACSPGSDVVFH